MATSASHLHLNVAAPVFTFRDCHFHLRKLFKIWVLVFPLAPPPPGSEVVTGSSSVVPNVPILGLSATPTEGGGRVIVYGDSNCLDSAHMQRDCFWLLETLIKYATGSAFTLPPFKASEQVRGQPTALPQHMDGERSSFPCCVYAFFKLTLMTLSIYIEEFLPLH